VFDENVYEIAAVEDQWYSPEAMFFSPDGATLRYDERAEFKTEVGARKHTNPVAAMNPILVLFDVTVFSF